MKNCNLKTSAARFLGLCLFLMVGFASVNAQAVVPRTPAFTDYEGIDVPTVDRPALIMQQMLDLEAAKAEMILNEEMALDAENTFTKMMALLVAERNDAIATGKSTIFIDQEINRWMINNGKAKTEGTTPSGSGSSSGGSL